MMKSKVLTPLPGLAGVYQDRGQHHFGLVIDSQEDSSTHRDPQHSGNHPSK